MRWLEFIRLCTTAERAQELAQVLSVMAREVQEKPGVSACIVVRHALYDGQLGVAMVHDDSSGAPQTKEALAVADYLRHYGLVDHQAWSVVHPGDPSEPAAPAAPSPGERPTALRPLPLRR